jgi:AraC-like DNA-binding protein
MNASEFVARYIEAWNRRDAQAIASHLSEQGTYLDITIDQEMSRDELLVHLDALFQLEPYRYELVGEVCAGVNTIAFQYRAVPRESTEGSDGWFGAEFITLSSNVATEIVDYYEQRGVAAPRSPLADAAGPGKVQRYAKSGLGARQMGVLKQQLTALMERERVYLRSDLALPELADMLDCSINHLSQVINAGFGVSFFDYLNRYRVREAMQLLGPGEGGKPTVLSVALQVGFNSTSTFYAAFKKVTGKTPAQYRRSLAD